jgi:hypothetical protein
MSSNNPLELIDQYLDRVRVYLPLDSEDAIVELQTHLIEEAERIGIKSAKLRTDLDRTNANFRNLTLNPKTLCGSHRIH